MAEQITLDTVLKELHVLSGFRISIHDVEFTEIAAYPRGIFPFCRMLQENPMVKQICQENDREAFEIVKKAGDVYLYQCRFGLYEAVAPLYHFGVLTGYLMMGQTVDTLENSRAYILSAALPYVSDVKRLEEEIKLIPSSSKERILSCINLLRICSEYITLTNRLAMTDRNLAHEVKKYICKNFASNITMDELCRTFLCSKSTIMNNFKQAYGKTVNQYWTEVRLAHAKELLQSTRMPVHQIAQESGFSEQNYFTKVFVKAEGMPPTSFRKNHRMFA